MPPSDPIEVVFITDGNYAMPLSVAIASAATNCDRSREVVFNVFFNRFPDAERAKVEQSLKAAGGGRARIAWREIDVARFGRIRVVHHYMNPIIYARLKIPDLMPGDVGKALYLDSDLVVLGDLAELWDTPMKGAALLAVRDRIGRVSAPGGLKNHEALGIAPQAGYFNSGVMVMDLARWRAEGIGERVLAYVEANGEAIQMGDQDGLNAVLHDDWGELDFRWNWQVVPDIDKARRRGAHGLDLQEKSIVHFVTSVKPWIPGCTYPERALFYSYLDRTAFAGWRLPAWREMLVRAKRMVRRALPGDRD